jgi:membrane protease YdiL (CAAX protease family)
VRPTEPDSPRSTPHERQPESSGTRPLRTGPLWQAAAFYAWVIAIVTLAQLLLYPVLRDHLHSRWALLGVQLGIYLLLVAPVALWFPQTLTLLRAPTWQICLGVVVAAAALAYQAAEHHAGAVELVYLAVTFGPVGFIEELLFRGFIWDRCREAGLGPVLVVVVNAVTFALWHVPAVLSDHGGLTELAYDAGLGLALSLVRLWSGNTTLGGLLHAAWDISGGP